MTDSEMKEAEAKSLFSVSRQRLFPWSSLGKAEEHFLPVSGKDALTLLGL